MQGLSLPLPRMFAGALSIPTGAYIIGGFESAQQSLTSSVLLFNSTTLTISSTSPLPVAIARPAVSEVDTLVPGVTGAVVTAGTVDCGDGTLCGNNDVQTLLFE